jgi:hypothetical protein
MAELLFRAGSGFTVSCQQTDMFLSSEPQVAKLEGKGSLEDMRKVVKEHWSNARSGVVTVVGGTAQEVCPDRVHGICCVLVP